MINLESQVQNVLDSLGIHLDAESFTNLLGHLRIHLLTWSQKMALAIALGVLVQYLQKRQQEKDKNEPTTFEEV